jgi:hypothetical protein
MIGQLQINAVIKFDSFVFDKFVNVLNKMYHTKTEVNVETFNEKA